jgi:hypothetical protein
MREAEERAKEEVGLRHSSHSLFMDPDVSLVPHTTQELVLSMCTARCFN